MTYTEIYNEGSDMATPGQKAAFAVLHGPPGYGNDGNSGLHDRCAFDHWWDQIDPEDQDEVFAEMVSNIEAALK